MKNSSYFGLAALVLVALLALFNAAYTVGQTEQALVLRFGEPVPGRSLVTAPGLHFKVPFVENVSFFDNRILDLETAKQEVLASDNNRIEVDAFLRYRIVAPLQDARHEGVEIGGGGLGRRRSLRVRVWL